MVWNMIIHYKCNMLSYILILSVLHRITLAWAINNSYGENIHFIAHTLRFLICLYIGSIYFLLNKSYISLLKIFKYIRFKQNNVMMKVLIINPFLLIWLEIFVDGTGYIGFLKEALLFWPEKIHLCNKT